MTLLVGVGPYLALVLAAVLAVRALVVARGRRFRPLANRMGLVSVPLAILFGVSIALRLLTR
jgi:hypothetical protein